MDEPATLHSALLELSTAFEQETDLVMEGGADTPREGGKKGGGGDTAAAKCSCCLRPCKCGTICGIYGCRLPNRHTGMCELPDGGMCSRRRSLTTRGEGEDARGEPFEELAAVPPLTYAGEDEVELVDQVQRDEAVPDEVGEAGETTSYTCIEDETVEMVAQFCEMLPKDLIAKNRTNFPKLFASSSFFEGTKLAVPAGCPQTRRVFARDTRVEVDFDGKPELGVVQAAWAMEDQDDMHGDVWVEYQVNFDDGDLLDDIKENEMRMVND